MIGIYKISNSKGKVYIGQSLNLEKREKTYFIYKSFGFQVKLKNSVLKYGLDNHFFEIIEYCSETNLNARERYWQEHYNSVNKGLNCRLTGTDDKSGRLGKETRAKMSESAKKVIKAPMSEETKIKIANYRRNRNWSEDIKAKISKSNSKAVYLYSKTGELLMEFLSLEEASNHFNISKSVICNNVKGLSKITKQGIWKMK